MLEPKNKYCMVPPTLRRALRFLLRLLYGRAKDAPAFLDHVFLERVELGGFSLAPQPISLTLGAKLDLPGGCRGLRMGIIVEFGRRAGFIIVNSSPHSQMGGKMGACEPKRMVDTVHINKVAHGISALCHAKHEACRHKDKRGGHFTEELVSYIRHESFGGYFTVCEAILSLRFSASSSWALLAFAMRRSSVRISL